MKISECCGAELLGSDVDLICSNCKEHADAVDDTKTLDTKTEVASILNFMRRQADKQKTISGVSISVNDSKLLTQYITELESTLANREEHIARMEKENAVLNRAVDIVISEVERYRLAYESGGYSVMSDIEWRESYRGNVLAQSKGLCNAD
jgi:predicted nuclease with TOPRIM domain